MKPKVTREDHVFTGVEPAKRGGINDCGTGANHRQADTRDKATRETFKGVLLNGGEASLLKADNIGPFGKGLEGPMDQPPPVEGPRGGSVKRKAPDIVRH